MPAAYAYQASHAERRGLFARAMLDFFREMAETHGSSDDLSDYLPNYAIVLAVQVGQGDGREMTVTDIAHYINAPRATVWRAVRRMEKRGHVRVVPKGKRKIVLHQQLCESEVAVRKYEATTKFVRSVAALYP